MLDLDEDAQAGMNNRTNLQSLCETTWFSHVNALHTFKSALTAVVTALEHLKKDGTAKPGATCPSNIDFIIRLLVIYHIPAVHTV